VAAAVRHFKENGQFKEVKDSSVRGWRDVYFKKYKILKEESRKQPRGPVKVEELPKKSRGNHLCYRK